jgi:hypothetical protein
MTPTHKRRWFRFSLRWMMIMMALLGIGIGYHLNWLDQRRAFLAREGVLDWTESYKNGNADRPQSPGLLPLLGEKGVGGLLVTDGSGQEVIEAEQLFPEADIFQVMPISGAVKEVNRRFAPRTARMRGAHP